MSIKEITFRAKSVKSTGGMGTDIDVTVEVDPYYVLEQIEPADIVSEVGTESLLDHMSLAEILEKYHVWEIMAEFDEEEVQEVLDCITGDVLEAYMEKPE